MVIVYLAIYRSMIENHVQNGQPYENQFIKINKWELHKDTIMDHKNILNFSEHKKLSENIILIPKLIMTSISIQLLRF